MRSALPAVPNNFVTQRIKSVLTRLLTADPAEIGFRCREYAGAAAEAVGGSRHWRREALHRRLLVQSPSLEEGSRALRRRDWARAGRALKSHFRSRAPRFTIDPANRMPLVRRIADGYPAAARHAAGIADAVLRGHFDLLGYKGLDFTGGAGDIDWHFDPVHDRRAPLAFWTRVRYLDPSIGDHKIIWEINRHQHWLHLGRAAWLTGDSRYAAGIVRDLRGWMEANPPLTGINWASMLEIAFRSISWIWALHFLLAADDDPDAAWIVDLLVGLDRQLGHISRHLSVYFSPNTHLLGEGLALYVAGRVLPELRSARRWEGIGRGILLREAHAQVNPDGGHAEMSAHYHRYALDFYLLALTVARSSGDPAAARFEEVALRLSTFCEAIADNGHLPGIGDDDGGQLFPICRRPPSDVRDSLAVAAALLAQPRLSVGSVPEEAFWMCGAHSRPPEGLAAGERPPSVDSKLFPDTGYAVLRSREAHAVLDVGRHGFLNGGHAHADALSLVLSVGGRPFLIDPGTATYTINATLRDRFRSTPMHNTVVLDRRPQSMPAGPFHWQSRADARLDQWRANRGFDYVEGLHDGYAPLVHRRAVLRSAGGLWIVADHVLGAGRHEADVYWHLDPAWALDGAIGDSVQFVHREGATAALATTAGGPRVFHGDDDGLGWCAPVYGQLVPSLTLRFTEAGEAPRSIVTAIAAACAPRLSLRECPMRTDGEDGWHRIGVTGDYGECVILALFAAPLAGGSARCLQRIAAPGGEFSTDARAAVLALSRQDEPVALTLVDARHATWTGPGAFDFTTPTAAADLHLDQPALARLSAKLDVGVG